MIIIIVFATITPSHRAHNPYATYKCLRTTNDQAALLLYTVRSLFRLWLDVFVFDHPAVARCMWKFIFGYRASGKFTQQFSCFSLRCARIAYCNRFTHLSMTTGYISSAIEIFGPDLSIYVVVRMHFKRRMTSDRRRRFNKFSVWKLQSFNWNCIFITIHWTENLLAWKKKLMKHPTGRAHPVCRTVFVFLCEEHNAGLENLQNDEYNGIAARVSVHACADMWACASTQPTACTHEWQMEEVFQKKSTNFQNSCSTWHKINCG